MPTSRTTPRLTDDPWLEPYFSELHRRKLYIQKRMKSVRPLLGWADFFGLHKLKKKWIFREWLPNATAVWLIGTFSNWEKRPEYQLYSVENGAWEITLPVNALHHGDQFGLHVCWEGGEGYRLPSTATRVVRQENAPNEYGVAFNAQVWNPETPYRWKHRSPRAEAPIIYESHVGMATSECRVGTFTEYTRDILPRIARAGYNTVQLMGIQQHPYYGSFGYHVSSFYSICDLFGTPEEFKELVDTAHGLGLRVIIDLVHSHAVKNPIEGIGCQDGTEWIYCHAGSRGHHPAWDSRCFDYGKNETCAFLLDNCRFWLKEYHLDGFRFDGVTSMLYLDHGLGKTFNGYGDYFTINTDWDAVAYLAMANSVIHSVRKNAITIAEDVSGLPGLASSVKDGGCGFDYRLAMGVTDLWFKLLDLPKDEDWPISQLWHELTNHRPEEKCISYVECHDQALVGGKTFLFTLLDKEMYTQMHRASQSLIVERGMALHKLARLVTFATACGGFLTFMGNEFGHPEWIDFPRIGNNWSYEHARRLWYLRDDCDLRYAYLADFDQAVVHALKNSGNFLNSPSVPIHIDDARKIIAFERNGLFFAFNFHPCQSQPNLELQVPPGTYTPILDSDDPQFGGHGLIGRGWQTTAVSKIENSCQNWVITLNLPPRTAIILKRHAN